MFEDVQGVIGRRKSRNDLQYSDQEKNHQVKLLFTKHYANSTM
jgi:hypothetical protein